MEQMESDRMELSTRADNGATRRFVVHLYAAAAVAIRALQASAVVLVLLVIWALTVAIFDPPSFLLPSPGAVWNSITNPLMSWHWHFWVTAQEAVGGFLIALVAGIAFGVGIAWSPLGSRLILTPLVVFNTLPKVAIAPLVIIYLGFGVSTNAGIAALLAFFPIVINTAVGLLQTDEDLIDMARSVDAPKWRVFALLRIPSAVPYILSGLKISSTMAVTGAVFGEFLAAREGLGSLVISTQTNLQMDIAFAALFWLAILGVTLYYSVDLAGRRLFPWVERSNLEG